VLRRSPWLAGDVGWETIGIEPLGCLKSWQGDCLVEDIKLLNALCEEDLVLVMVHEIVHAPM